MRSIEPPLRLLFCSAVEVYWKLRTWGMHPLAPEHGQIAIKRAAMRGGVRLP